MRWLILLILLSCSEEDMKVRQIFGFFGSSVSESNWWLAGDIPESTDYTIYDPATASDSNDALINLSNPGTRDAVAYNSPTWTSGIGWTGNATNMYFDTQTTFDTNTTIIVMYRDPTSGRYLFGALQNTPIRTASIVPYSSTNVGWEMAGSFTSTASRHLGGTIAATMTNGFRNGVKDTGTSFVWSGSATTRTIKLLAYDAPDFSPFGAIIFLNFSHILKLNVLGSNISILS